MSFPPFGLLQIRGSIPISSAAAIASQDADWENQKPVVERLAKVAKDFGVPLKFIFTVWSAPASMKVALDASNEPIPSTPHQPGTKKGGTLDPAKYKAYGNWLADGIQVYKDWGIDVYAISQQNEPYFKQDFNSTFYKPQKWYGEMIKNSIPVVKARFPKVMVFGSENMVAIEGGKDRQWFYGPHIMKDPAVLSNEDGVPEMSRQRQLELDLLRSAAFRKSLQRNQVQPITYRELIKRNGWPNGWERQE